MLTAKQIEEIREMLRNTTSSDGFILKRAGTSLSALCEYIERLERVAERAKAARKAHPEQVCLGIKMALNALDGQEAGDVQEVR